MPCILEYGIYGWKKAYTADRRLDVVVKLFLPPGTRVCRTERGIWRCNRAEVVSITSPDGKHSVRTAASCKDPDFFYRVGETVESNARMSVTPLPFCGDKSKEKGPGIYFFPTEEEALEYDY